METASRHSSAAVGSRVFLGMDDESRRATVGSLIATKRGATRSRLWKRLRRCWRRAPDEEKASVGAGNPECSRAPVPNTGVHLCRLGRPVDTTNFRTAERLSFYFLFYFIATFLKWASMPCGFMFSAPVFLAVTDIVPCPGSEMLQTRRDLIKHSYGFLF